MTQNDSSTQTIHDGGNDAPQPPQDSSARRPAFNMDDLPDLRDNAPDPDALRKAEFTTVYDLSLIHISVSISASTNRARSPKHCANCLKYCGPRNSKCRRSAVCCSIRAKVSSSSTPISRTCTPIDLARLMLHCVRFEYDLSSSLSSPIPVMSLANRQRTVDV